MPRKKFHNVMRKKEEHTKRGREKNFIVSNMSDSMFDCKTDVNSYAMRMCTAFNIYIIWMLLENMDFIFS